MNVVPPVCTVRLDIGRQGDRTALRQKLRYDLDQLRCATRVVLVVDRWSELGDLVGLLPGCVTVQIEGSDAVTVQHFYDGLSS